MTPRTFFMAPLIAYLAVELVVRMGIDLSSLTHLHEYGLVDALEPNPERRLQLTLHFLAQIAITPVAMTLSLRYVWRKRKELTVKHFSSGAVLTGLMGCFLFLPNNTEHTVSSSRLYLAIPLIERFNVAYAIAQGLFVFCFSLGLAMSSTWLAHTSVKILRRIKSSWTSPGR